MAATNSLPDEDITCPQCTDIYCLPVLLKCGHNICRVCLFKFWEWKGLRECPVCGHVSETGRPPINLTLHNIAKEHKVLIMTKNKEECPQHSEKLQIFCHNDEELICVICQLTKEHKIHHCSPIEEASQEKKVCKNGIGWRGVRCIHQTQEKKLFSLSNLLSPNNLVCKIEEN